MAETLIRVDNLAKKFCRDFRTSLTYALADVGAELVGAKRDGQDLRPKEFWALKDISFELKRGETLGLLGANGAGKSTLLKLLNGLIKPSAGRIDINGSMQALIELGGAFSPQLSGRENIYASAAMIGMNRKEIDAKFDEIVAFAELKDFIEAPVGTYSSGMKTRLGFSVATCIRPEILILDEVLSVGDARFRAKSMDKVQEVRGSASSIIFVSHNIYQIKRLCTRCLVLDKGRLVADMEVDDAIAVYLDVLNATGKDERMGEQTLNIAGALNVTDFRVMQSGRPTSELMPAPFTYQLDLTLDQAYPDLWLDIGIADENLNYPVLQSLPLPQLNNRTGKATVTATFPALPFGSRNLFPYIGLVDGATGHKLLKYNVPQPLRFTGSASTGSALLQPPLEVSVA